MLKQQRYQLGQAADILGSGMVQQNTAVLHLLDGFFIVGLAYVPLDDSSIIRQLYIGLSAVMKDREEIGNE